MLVVLMQQWIEGRQFIFLFYELNFLGHNGYFILSWDYLNATVMKLHLIGHRVYATSILDSSNVPQWFQTVAVTVLNGF